MIERIHIKGFKSLADVSMELGSFNLLIGPNASGKSNFLEALRVLQGLALGFTVDEVLNGKSRSATGEVWEGMRGGSAAVAFGGEGFSLLQRPPKQVAIGVTLRVDAPEALHYSVSFSPRDQTVSNEKLAVGDRTQLEANLMEAHGSTLALREGGASRQITAERSALFQQQVRQVAVLEDEFVPAFTCFELLHNQQRLEPTPQILREYSLRHGVKRMGDRGEDFAAVVEAIIQDSATRSAFEEWLRQIAPGEIESVEVAKGAQDDVLFAVRRQGKRRTLAPSLSDGTLRFAALAAAFFQKDVPKILLLEEIENGIHPPRIRALLDLLRSQSARTGCQVFATTHSPVVLDWLTPDDYRHAFWFRRDEVTGATEVTPLSRIPNFAKLVKKYPPSELFTEGWLETVP